MTTHVPEGTADETVAAVRAREAAHTRDLAAQGHVLRLWALPSEDGAWHVLGPRRAADDAELTRMLDSLPLDPWMTVQTTPLTPHPGDPGVSTSSSAP